MHEVVRDMHEIFWKLCKDAWTVDWDFSACITHRCLFPFSWCYQWWYCFVHLPRCRLVSIAR